MTIPEQAKKVFEGIIFDVYQWEQERYDGSTATWEMLKRAPGANVIATVGDKILVVEEEQPVRGKFLGLAGGQIEPGEEPLDAAKREFLEETGMASENWTLFRTIDPSSKIDWEVYTYLAKDCKRIKDAHPEPGEKISVKEVSFDEFVDFVMEDDFRILSLKIEVMKRKIDGTLDELEKEIFG